MASRAGILQEIYSLVAARILPYGPSHAVTRERGHHRLGQMMPRSPQSRLLITMMRNDTVPSPEDLVVLRGHLLRHGRPCEACRSEPPCRRTERCIILGRDLEESSQPSATLCADPSTTTPAPNSSTYSPRFVAAVTRTGQPMARASRTANGIPSHLDVWTKT
jgi:hypothetical protein